MIVLESKAVRAPQTISKPGETTSHRRDRKRAGPRRLGYGHESARSWDFVEDETEAWINVLH